MTGNSGYFSAGRGQRAPPTGPASPSRAGAGFPFVGGRKATLARLIREKGIFLTPEAQARFDALPEQFLDFITAPVKFAEQLEAA